ncbi:hypothetical protein [Kushneria indalinina]|uniref:Uncharacterized protein n=1 Tax=Kushneria indalinina DSM 14324 TaxID=1122140 RepID=A0A3D9E0U8_9GAMM|nr:hypothetical protein [Kushneria indalinina]REC96658.1 hypothetical protein C8D72_0015 [Kushneria indalinina DSM 14324]
MLHTTISIVRNHTDHPLDVIEEPARHDTVILQALDETEEKKDHVQVGEGSDDVVINIYVDGQGAYYCGLGACQVMEWIDANGCVPMCFDGEFRRITRTEYDMLS